MNGETFATLLKILEEKKIMEKFVIVHLVFVLIKNRYIKKAVDL